MSSFNPSNWYWYVGGNQTQAYSSASGNYVPSTDVTFQAWLAAGNIPTNIDTEANLGQVLSGYLLRPVAAGVLSGYTAACANSTVALVEFKLLFNHENRIRAIERALGLNGSPANLTAQQAFNAVQALM